jgi:hypothetical protein
MDSKAGSIMLPFCEAPTRSAKPAFILRNTRRFARPSRANHLLFPIVRLCRTPLSPRSFFPAHACAFRDDVSPQASSDIDGDLRPADDFPEPDLARRGDSLKKFPWINSLTHAVP